MPVHVPGHLSGIRCPPLFWRERAFLVRGKKTVVVDPASILFTQPLLINAHELHCAPVETPSSRVYFLLSERCDECERIRDCCFSCLVTNFVEHSPISSSLYTSDIFPYRYWHPEPQQLLRGHENVPKAKSPSKSPMRKKTKGVSRFLSTPVSDGCVRNLYTKTADRQYWCPPGCSPKRLLVAPPVAWLKNSPEKMVRCSFGCCCGVEESS